MKMDNKGNGTTKFNRWPEALIVLQSIVYGFGDPISKIAFEVTPVYTMMSVRYCIAFVAGFILFRRRITETVRKVPVRYWLVPGLLIGLTYLLNNVALSLTDATSVAFLRSLSVVLTPLFAFIALGRRYSQRIVFIQVMVLPGMYLLCVKGGLSGFGAGEVVTIAAAAVMACALIASRKYLEDVDPVALTVLMAGCSAALALIGSFVFEGGLHLETTTGQAWMIIIYLAIACTLLGYMMQNIALTKISERSVALIQSLCPVMTAVFSFFILGEKLSVAGVIGAIIIICCVTAATALSSD